MKNFLIAFDSNARKIDFFESTNFEIEINKVDISNKQIIQLNGKDFFLFIDGYILDENPNSILNTILNHEEKIKDFEGSFNIFFYDFQKNQFKIIKDFWGSRCSYLYQKNKKYIFSSRTKNIQLFLEDKMSINKDTLENFLLLKFPNSKNTFFNEIERILPNSTYEILNQDINIISHSSLPSEAFKETDKYFPYYLDRAVRRRTNFFKNSKIGVMFSGGLDSSSIALAIHNVGLKNINLYSADFSHVNDNNINEYEFQENVRKLTQYKLARVKLKSISPVAEIKNSIKVFNEPVLFPNLYMFNSLIKNMVDDNIKILFDGNDGDNVVSHGYEVLYNYFIKFRHLKLIKELFYYSKFHNKKFIKTFINFYKLFFKTLFNLNSPKYDTLLKAKIAEKYNNDQLHIFASHKNKLLNELQYYGFEQRYLLFNYYGIEIVSPFYDRELISYCLIMPGKNKINNGRTRSVLRDYLSKKLEESHYNRPYKSILTQGIYQNLNIEDFEEINQEFNRMHPLLIDIIDYTKLKKIIRKGLINKSDVSEMELMNLFAFYALNLFLKDQNL